MLIEPEQPFHYLQQTRQSQSTFFPVRDTKKKRRKRRQRDFIESINPFTGVPAGFYRAYAMSSPIQQAPSTLQDAVQEGEERGAAIEQRASTFQTPAGQMLGSLPFQGLMTREQREDALVQELLKTPMDNYEERVDAFNTAERIRETIQLSEGRRFDSTRTPANSDFLDGVDDEDRSTPAAQRSLFSPSPRTPLQPQALDPQQRQAGKPGRTEGFYNGQQ